MPAVLDRSTEQEMTHREIIEMLIGLLAALFTALVSSTIVSNALPTIIADLNGSQTQYTWVVTISLLTMTISTPIWAKLSDLYNKKVLVQTAIIVFVIGSVLAGASQNVETLLGFRGIQGIGMGGLTALAQSIIGSVIPPRERGRYSGYMGGTMALAMVSGPLLGGIIVDTSWLGWRWCFYVCVPLAIVSLGVLQRYLHIRTVRRKVVIDYVGAILLAITAGTPLVWVSFAGDSYDWISGTSAIFWAVTIIAGVLTVIQETRHREALVPMRVLRDRTTALAIIASMAVGIAMFGGPVFLGQYFQIARDHSPTAAGLLTIPMMVGSLFGTAGSGQVITRTGRWKVFLVVGSTTLIVGLLLLGTIDHATPLWHVSIFMFLMGLGAGMLMQNLVLAVQNTVDVTEVGAASGAVAFFRSLGGAIGVSVLGAILANHVKDNMASGLARIGIHEEVGANGGASALDLKKLPAPIAHVVRESYGDATSVVFAVGGVVAIAALLAALFIKEVPLRTSVHLDKEAKAESESDVDTLSDQVAPEAAPRTRAERRGADGDKNDRDLASLPD
ncbi:MDR family MFS transporter [Dermacoccaceae bacterium W4C1]